MSVNHLNDNKTVYMKDKSEEALDECFQRCNKGANDYKTLTSRQISCIGISSPIQSTAPLSSSTLTPTPLMQSTMEASPETQKVASKIGLSNDIVVLKKFEPIIKRISYIKCQTDQSIVDRPLQYFESPYIPKSDGFSYSLGPGLRQGFQCQ